MPEVTINITLEEQLGVNDLASKQALFDALADTGLDLIDLLQHYKSIRMGLSEVIDLASALGLYHVNQEQVDEGLGVSPELAFKRSLYKAIHEGIGLEISFLFPQGVFGHDIEDEFDLEDEPGQEDVGDVEDEVWDCWVLNTQELNPSVYSGFNFNSYAEYQGVTYATSKDGIYELSDEHDEKFQTGVVLPATSLGMANAKRFRLGYLGFVGGVPAVKAVVDDGQERVFKVVRNKFTLHRDMVGRRWQFTVAEFESLDFVELFPIILTKSRQKW